MTFLETNNLDPKPIKRTNSRRVFPLSGILYIFSMTLVLMIWPFRGIHFALTVGIIIITGFILATVVWEDVQKGRWSQIVVEKSVPGILWLLFCVGAIVAMLRPEDMRYYGEYEDSTVLLMALYAFIGAVSYLIGFRLIYKSPTKNTRENDYSKAKVRLALLLLVLLLSIDWYTNLKLINSGLFFDWVARKTFDLSLRGTDIMFHMQRTTLYLITPLLLYLISVSRRKKKHILMFIILIIFQTMLLILKGNRRELVYAGFIFIFSYAVIFHLKIRLRGIQWVILSVLVFLIFSPVIQESRFLMRVDIHSVAEDPIMIPILYITEYIPKAFSQEYILRDPDSRQRKIGLIGRVGSYMSYAASMYQAYLDGVSLRPVTDLKITLQTMIPRFIYPQKPSIDADASLLEHFGIGVPGSDSNGTPLADIFSFLHIYGVIGLFAIMGFGFGFVTKHLKKNYGLIGKIIIIGLFPVLVPIGDSFAEYLVDLRNVLIFIVVVAVLDRFTGVIDYMYQVTPVTRRAE